MLGLNLSSVLNFKYSYYWPYISLSTSRRNVKIFSEVLKPKYNVKGYVVSHKFQVQGLCFETPFRLCHSILVNKPGKQIRWSESEHGK